VRWNIAPSMMRDGSHHLVAPHVARIIGKPGGFGVEFVAALSGHA